MKFIDFFAGIGGFRRGMELAGHECVGFCEFDKFATASYISMHLLTEEQPTAGASDSLARTYPLQESKPDFKETVQACFSELCTLSDNSKKKINPLTFSLRTLKICLVLMEDGISPDCSLKWSSVGMMQNGRCSTLKISECHKTGKDVLLSDILEGEVPQKYFLSKEQTEKIVFR